MNKISKTMAIGLAFLLAAFTVWAADVSGKWIANAAGAELTLELKVDGAQVTGTLNNPQAGPAEIKEGKIEGDAISFHVVRTINNAETKVNWKGTVAGEEIKFTRQAEGAAAGPATEIIAKRAP
jgi:hypothetical protein